MMKWRKLFRITLRKWDSSIKSDFFFVVGESVGQVLLTLEAEWLDLDEVKAVEEVEELLIFIPRGGAG